MLPFIPTCVENLHIKRQHYYGDDEVQDREHPAAIPSPSPSVQPKKPDAIVGAVPVKKCKASRKGYRRSPFPRKKATVQLRDDDRNRDIGHTHNAHNQGYDRRTDLEARENEADIGTLAIRERNIPDPIESVEGDLSQAGWLEGKREPASYSRGRKGRNALTAPTKIDKQGRKWQRIFKVLGYWSKGVSARRTAQLMHIEEREVKAIRRWLRKEGITPDRAAARDSNGKFTKSRKHA